MFEMGDVVYLPLRFGNSKKGVLIKRESDGKWLIQLGTSAFEYLVEDELRSITRISSCWKCGARLNVSHDPACSDCIDECQCPVCGTRECKRADKED